MDYPNLKVRQRLKNAVFDSLDARVAAIEGCIEHRNARDARPFRWNRGPERISWSPGSGATGGSRKWNQINLSTSGSTGPHVCQLHERAVV